MAKALKASEQGRYIRTEIENPINPDEVDGGYYAHSTKTVMVATSRWEWTYDMDAVHPEHYETEGEYPKGSSDNSAPIVEHYATYEAHRVEDAKYGSAYSNWKRTDRPEPARVYYPNYRSDWNDWQQARVGGIDKAEAWLNRTYRFVAADAPMVVRQARVVAEQAASHAAYEEQYALKRAEQAVKDALAALEQAKVEAAKARQDVAKVAQTIAAAKVEAAAAARKAEMVAAEVAV